MVARDIDASRSGHVSGAIALGIYDAVQELLKSAEARIPSRLDPLIQRALQGNGAPHCDPLARSRLESMSVQLDYLRAAQRARRSEQIQSHKVVLAGLASQWLDQTRVG